MNGLEALARGTIRIPTRIGEPMGVYGITDVLHDPANATGVGLLLWAIKTGGKPTWEAKGGKSNGGGAVNNVMELVKKFFGAS